MSLLRKFLKRMLQLKPRLKKLSLYAAAGLLLSFVMCWWVIPHFYSIPSLAEATPNQSKIVLDRDGKPLHHSTREDYIRNRHAALEDIPEVFIQATLAAEDKRFWDHGGIDILATSRAIKDALGSGRIVSGASTITQQTVKLATNTKERTLTAKMHEAFQARKMEMSYSKEEILTLYFNSIDYGNRTQGPQQAAQHYYNKSLDQLSLAESALLAGLPQAPTRHNPRTNPEGALKRRNWILDRMAIVYDIPQEKIDRAKREAVSLSSAASRYATPELEELFKENAHATITTTLSKPLYEKVKSIAQREIDKLKSQNVNNAAVVVIHNPTGEILCLLGSPNFDSPLGGQYNAALLPRSPGSALKPLAYLMGFEKRGLTPATIIPDVPTSYPGDRGPEAFVNYDRKHHGPVTISQSLGNSFNIPAVRVLNQSGGPEKFLSYLQNFGFTTLNSDPRDYGLTLAIGGGEITLLEICNAYATIARQGVFKPTTLTKKALDQRRVADATQCYLLAQIMTDNHARSQTFGIESQLRFPFPCAVKTGTSTDYKDNFCVGFTKEFTVGVWVGNIDQSPMQGISGVAGAGPIFHQTMLELHKKSTPSWLTKPQGVQTYTIDPHTGKILESGHPRRHLAQHISLFDTPDSAEISDYDGGGKPILDQRYHEWVKNNTSQFTLSSSTVNNAPKSKLRILSPTADATYLLDPDLPNSGSKLSLSASIPLVDWSCKTLLITNSSTTLTPGNHVITATSKDGKQTHTVHIKVRKL